MSFFIFIGHWRNSLGAPGTRDPYFTSIKKFLGQKTNLKHHSITKFANFIVQDSLQVSKF